MAVLKTRNRLDRIVAFELILVGLRTGVTWSADTVATDYPLRFQIFNLTKVIAEGSHMNDVQIVQDMNIIHV